MLSSQHMQFGLVYLLLISILITIMVVDDKKVLQFLTKNGVKIRNTTIMSGTYKITKTNVDTFKMEHL